MIYFEHERRADRERAFLDRARMRKEIALLGRIGDAEAHAIRGHHAGVAAGVAALAAGFAIERGLIEDDGAALALPERLDLLAVLHQRRHDAFGRFGFVAQELGCADILAQAEPHALGRSLARARPSL